jgi:hypothetical protein
VVPAVGAQQTVSQVHCCTSAMDEPPTKKPMAGSRTLCDLGLRGAPPEYTRSPRPPAPPTGRPPAALTALLPSPAPHSGSRVLTARRSSNSRRSAMEAAAQLAACLPLDVSSHWGWGSTLSPPWIFVFL